MQVFTVQLHQTASVTTTVQALRQRFLLVPVVVNVTAFPINPLS